MIGFQLGLFRPNDSARGLCNLTFRTLVNLIVYDVKNKNNVHSVHIYRVSQKVSCCIVGCNFFNCGPM